MASLTASVVLLSAFLGAGAGPSLVLRPPRPKSGDVVMVQVDRVKELPTGTLADRALNFYSYGRHFEALAAVPVDTAPGLLNVQATVRHGRGPPVSLNKTLDVRDPHYPSRELEVEPKFAQPPPELKHRIAEDRKAFAKAYAQPLRPRLFKGAFEWPRKRAKVTAPFGDKRVFNGVKDSQHYGTDLQGKVGDPVRAANDGRVVLVRECFSSGNTVLLDHGGGVFTAYFHLSKFQVHDGQRVRLGDRIGLVGETGRVTGPHLHFAVHVSGLYVDPASLLSLKFPGK